MKMSGLIVIFLAIFAIEAQAAPYIITGSSGSFTATLDGSPVGVSYQPIQDVINAIKADAVGGPCTIRFGNGSNVLDIGNAYIRFEGTEWGLITLEGKITSQNQSVNYTTILVNDVSVESTADIANTSNTSSSAIRNNNVGSVNIKGGTVSATGSSGRAIYNWSSGKIIVSGSAKITSENADASKGTIYLESSGSGTAERLIITGGTVENTAINGNAIYNSSTGAVTISGGTVSATRGTAVSGGTITISGGTVSATTGTAVKGNTVAISGGTVSATTGAAVSGGTVAISGGTVLATDNDGYAVRNSTVTISGGNVSATGIAILNDNANSVLLGGSPNITGVIKAELGKLSLVASGGDKFAPAASNTYTLNFISPYFKGSTAVPNGKDYISNFRLQNQCYALTTKDQDIVVGQRLATCPYVITSSGIYFTAATGGSAMTPNAAIQDVINNIKTDAAGGDVIIQFGNSNSMLAISSGARISFDGGTEGTDWGLITLNGKIISSYNGSSSSGTINASNGVSINSTADIANDNGTAIYNNSTGTVTISGGTISAKARYTATIYNNSSGKIIISGGDISATIDDASLSYVVANNSTGEVIISGGTISVTTGTAVYNKSSGKITVSGGAKITSSTREVTRSAILNDGTGTVEITGGTVECTGVNNDVKTVNNASTGTVSISGGIISTKTGYAVYNASTGAVAVSGGLLFAYSAATDVIYGAEISGNAVIMKWNEAVGRSEYTLGTKTDISVLPATATAEWSKMGGFIGISYANGENTGFIAPATLPTRLDNFAQLDTLAKTLESWAAYTDKADKGASTIGNENRGTATVPDYVVVMKDGDDSVAKIKNYTLSKGANPNDPYVGLYLYAENNGTNYDLSKCINGFRYAYKGASHDFMVQSKLITDFNYHRIRISSSSVWKTANVNYNQLTQENWGAIKTLNFGDINRFAWQMKGDFSATTGELAIKDFYCLGNMPLPEDIEPGEPSSGPNPSPSSDGDIRIHLPQITIGNIRVQVASNSIVLKNLPSKAKVEAYNLQGRRIYSVYLENPEILKIGVKTKGMYIVKVQSGSETKLLRIPVM